MTPSASTAPVDTGRDRAYWTTVLHNAAQVPVTHPRYQEARSVIQLSLDNLQAKADSAADADIKAISPGPLGTAAVAFGHGASLGLAGDPTYLQLARQANPKTAFTADVAGTAALGGVASPLVAGLSPAAGGAVLGGALGAGRGAIEPIPGLTRAESALVGGTTGAVTGAAAGKIASKLVPIARTVSRNIVQLFGGSATQAQVEGVSEAAVRAELKRLGVRPEILERTVQAWKTGGGATGAPQAAPPIPMPAPPGVSLEPVPPKLPPGTLAPIPGSGGQGFEVTGQRATPPVPTSPTVAEILAGRSGPKGVGGHSYTGTYPAGTTFAADAARTVPSPVGGPTTPAAMQLKQLQLLVQLPEAEFEAASEFFPKAIMDEVRNVRLQFHGAHF